MAVHVDSSIRVQAAFYYEVTIDGSVISFQECSGLTLKNEKIEYRHSNSLAFTKEVRIGMTTLPEITFKKGIFEADHFLFDLFARTWDKAYMSHTDNNFDVSIALLDETGTVVCHWEATGCVVTQLEGPTLKSDDNSAAIEGLTIACNTFIAQF
jgi:phage tail-like protein